MRVDVIFDRLSSRNKAWVDLIGTVVFLLPFVGLVAWYGVNFTIESWELGERSGDPGGLPYRWIIKGMIPTAFAFTALTGIGMLLHSINR